MLTLNINGEAHDLEVDGETPLLWVLRDTLGLTGTKYGCGIAQCGACVVLLDGSPVPSCQTPVSAAANAKVVTIEGLTGTVAQAVQRAWTEGDVPQCGYCQSGQIVAAVALLSENPKPTDAEIDTAMTTHLCRCATYQRIRAGIHAASRALG